LTPDPIAIFEAGVSNIKSMADGSPRFEFESGESAIQFMTPLGQCKADKRYLMVIVYDMQDWERISAESTKVTG
jgi:hypothetical protein